MNKSIGTTSPPNIDDVLNEIHEKFPPADRLLNRELSWLNFNDRVLEEALDPAVPVLERLKFLAIFASNLDEFFQVRVAFVRRQIDAGITKRGPDGLRPAEVLEQIAERVHDAHERIGACYRNSIIPALSSAGITIVSADNATGAQLASSTTYFQNTLRSLITPLVLDPSHPFPQLENGALYFCIELNSGGHDRTIRRAGKHTKLLLVHIPTNVVGRFVRVPATDGTVSVMMIDEVIRHSLGDLFPGDEVAGCYQIKIVRDSELDLDEVGSVDLLKSIIDGLQRRKKGAATRFLYDPAMPEHLLERFAKQLKLRKRQMFAGARYHSFSDLIQLPAVVERPSLMYDQLHPLMIEELESGQTIVDVLKKKDVLLHHPYQSFSYVARFVEEAAADPSTVAIKATLYRLSDDSRIAAALARAARNDKKVTVLVELKARFDEERNISWARTLEEAGVHVIYGVKGLKTHCKMTLVVRKEGDQMRSYSHLSTGNYNERTARIYADMGLLTSHPGITGDMVAVFNRLTGDVPAKNYPYLLVAPECLREEFVRRIRREAGHANAGRPSGIIAKMNSLVDPDMIDELYAASSSGVPIKLIVRGICCLRPGVPGLSDSVEVISIIDRFLEHARIYRFENAGEPEVFLSSADWMPRNLNNRIEVAFPVLDAGVKGEVSKILDTQLRDNVKARILRADGTNHRRTGEPAVRSQWEMFELARRVAP